MQLVTFALLISTFFALCLAQTLTITCIGDRCEDDPKPTTTFKTSTKKTPIVTPTKSQKPPPQPPTTTQPEEVGPSSTRCPVPVYYKCGGWDVDKPWDGCTVCVKGAKCVIQNEWYYQCVAEENISKGMTIASM